MAMNEAKIQWKADMNNAFVPTEGQRSMKLWTNDENKSIMLWGLMNSHAWGEQQSPFSPEADITMPILFTKWQQAEQKQIVSHW